MSQSSPNADTVVGLTPWLPWPLSAWAWWAESVRAERLAAWRIAVALCLIADILLNYAPDTLAFYGKGGLGDPAHFDYRFEPGRLNWSLLRGVGDPANYHLSLLVWIATTFWILGNSFVRLLLQRQTTPPQDRAGVALWLWSAAFIWFVAGVWSQMLTTQKTFDALAWVVPLVGFSLACLFQALDVATRLRDPTHHISWIGLLFTIALAMTLTVLGYFLVDVEDVDKSAWWITLLRPWQENETMLFAAMFAWIAAAVLLLVGFWTRFAAVMSYVLSMSFAYANPHLDNAGDTIRVILLFYLMLCPCGAVWSVDALWKRGAGPVHVSPWPIRLMFVQMIFIYFMNGLYKLMGAEWVEGHSLHYVLGDVVMTRFSPSMFVIPAAVARVMTWTVLAWEVSFPVLVLWKWSRRAALVFGVLFHLGIFATMELGGFAPYALCMYVPLLPWGGEPRVRAATRSSE